MSLLTASNLGKAFGPDDIFTGVSLSVEQRARIGLVGPNGIGKTTLLRILAGQDESFEGQVFRARDLHSAYLPQEVTLHARHTLWEECLQAFVGLREMEAELAALEVAMGTKEGAQEAIERYGQRQEIFEHLGGYTYPARIRRTLSGLGFTPGQHRQPLNRLSGGQHRRALLARLLLTEPDLLILDEPTNHLDIASVEWLENHLREWRGAAVIVSHDRYFLDRVVNRVWELSPMGFETYRGNYSAYLEQRHARAEQRSQEFEREIARMENELDYIRRNIAGQRTAQAKGKLRRLSREVEAIEKGGWLAVRGKNWSEVSAELALGGRVMGVEEAAGRLKALRSPSYDLPDLSVALRPSRRSGDLVLRTRDLAVGYPDGAEALFQVPDLIFRRGECAAVIGPNGAGKTTFLKTLLGEIPAYQGEMELGASLQTGYFAQAHSELDPELNVLEEIQGVAPQMLIPEVRSYLARYQFRGDDVFKRVGVLSGGERGRLALAKLALSEANLLLLDEPTNHLDIPSQEILQAVLAAFEGTILLVSHDRYLIDALASQIWEIQPEASALTVFLGSYTSYRTQAEQLREEAAPAAPPARPARPAQANANSSRSPARRRARLEEIETEIRDKELTLARLSDQLEKPPSEPAAVEKMGREYVDLQDALDRLYRDWEELHES